MLMMTPTPGDLFRRLNSSQPSSVSVADVADSDVKAVPLPRPPRHTRPAVGWLLRTVLRSEEGGARSMVLAVSNGDAERNEVLRHYGERAVMRDNGEVEIVF